VSILVSHMIIVNKMTDSNDTQNNINEISIILFNFTKQTLLKISILVNNVAIIKQLLVHTAQRNVG